jgi:hypothetical protein
LRIFAPGILGGVKASGWQEEEAWMREGRRRRERMGRDDSMGEGMVVFVLGVLLSVFLSRFRPFALRAGTEGSDGGSSDEEKRANYLPC